MSYICQDCGEEYGDPTLDAIPIICSECVEPADDADTDEDEGTDEE